MKKNYISTMLVAMAIAAAPSVVQAQQYDFSYATNQSYSELQGGTSLNDGTIWDDPEYTIPIGFSFNYGGSSYTELSTAGLGGMLTFNSSFNGPTPILLPFNVDIIDFGSGDTVGSKSNISYQTNGMAGSRVLTIDWYNAGFYGDYDDDGTCTDYLDFQVILFEGSNIIEFRYGPNSITQPSISYEGDPGPNVGVLPYYNGTSDELEEPGIMLEGNPSTPTATEMSVGALSFVYLTGSIAEGTVYTFTPRGVGVAEVIQTGISLYPNPATDNIRLNGVKSNDLVEIINTNGQVVLQGKLLNTNSLNIKDLASGMYLLKVTGQDGISRTENFIKQ